MEHTEKLENTANQPGMVEPIHQLSFDDLPRGWNTYGASSERLGGLARVKTALRDNLGRFLHSFGFDIGDMDARIKTLFQAVKGGGKS